MKFLGKKYQKDHEKNGLLKINLKFVVQSLKNHPPPTQGGTCNFENIYPWV